MGGKSFGSLIRAGVLALGALLSGQAALAQSSLEQVVGGGPANGGAAVTLTTVATTVQKNTDNPGGTTFTAVTPGPVPTVTYTLSNQQYGNPVASSGTAVSFGTLTDPSIYYGPMNGIGAPLNSYFTSLSSVPAGTGIDVATNYGPRLMVATEGMAAGGAPLSGRIQMADLTITYSSPVTNPVIHLSGLGGFLSDGTSNKGFSTEFDFLNLAANNITSVSRLSGNSSFVQVGNSFNNSTANPNSSCQTGAAACGSVLVSGTNITTIQLRVFLRGTTTGGGATLAWNTVANASDALYVATSFEMSDMQPSLSGLPASVVPGTTYTGVSLTCTNNGPNTARGAFCTPSASAGTISNLVCTPAVPTDISDVTGSNTAVCTFDYLLPVSSTATSVVLTGQTGATNDRNGGSDGTAGNNQVQQTLSVTPNADLAVTKTNGGTSLSSGTTTTYTIRVTNNGPSSVTGATIADPAASGLTKTAAACSPTPGQCVTPPGLVSLESGTATLPTLASGQFYEFTVTANVTASSGSSVTNSATATVPSGTTDPTPGNNTGSDTDSVTPAPVFNCGVGSTATGSGFSTTGSSAYVSQLFWFDWSCGATTSFPPGSTINKSWDLGNGVVVTGQVTNITGGALAPYTTGSFFGDALDDLATGLNPLGLVNAVDTQDPSYSISWSATYNGAPFSPQLVAADAEDTDEIETITITTNGASWTTLESVGSLTSSGAGATRVFSDPGNPGGGTQIIRSVGPTRFDVAVSASGQQAVAFGIFVPADWSDAPAGYGLSSHLILPDIRLGATVTDELAALSDPNAAGDSDDGVTLPPIVPGATATVPVAVTQSAANSGFLQAWFDWNGDGDFADPGEQVATDVQFAGGPTGTINLSVPVPVSAVTTQSFARFRWSTTAGLGATGSATSGEVEDYAFTAGDAADLVVTKTDGVAAVGRTGSTTYTVRVTNNGPSTITGALLSDPAATGLSKTAVACSAAASNLCATAPSVSAIEGGVALPALAAGGFYEVTITATVTATSGSVTNTATIALPPGATDPVPSNNTASDTNTVYAIDAIDDTPVAINGFVGGSTVSVLGNDLLNGAPVVPSAITLTPGTAPTPAAGTITMNPDGTITVAAGTTAGTYSFPYTICENLNPSNCDTAVATVVVSRPVILALDDDYTTTPVVGADGGGLPSVLVNDTLNGAPVVPSAITLTPGTAPTPAAGSITMNPDGTITVAAGTTAGVYTYLYSICENLNPTNCSGTAATVLVIPPVIDAVDDAGSVANGATGGVGVPDVLVNDTLNGVPATLTTVTLTQVATTNPNVTLNPATGAVNVAPGTPAGTYVVSYQICEIINPTNCDTADATVTVGASVITAAPDTGTVLDGSVGGTGITNVLVNDSLNGAPATLATVTLAQLATTNPNVTLNPATGAVSVAAGTPAGTYLVTYQICEQLNPTNCATTTATVTVGAAAIDAVDDPFGAINGASGGATPSVLLNDTLSGAPATTGTVTLAPGAAPTPAAGSITMNPDGTITVAPGTTAGTYSYPYTICEILNPTNCDAATATFTVGAPVIDAINDAGTVPNGLAGGVGVPNVLTNDTLNGAPATLATVTLTQVSTTNPNVTLNPATGEVSVAPGTPAGTYTVLYQICDIVNPTNCDTASAAVTVGAAPIDAVDDAPAAIVGATGGSTPTVLGNDTLNGAPVVPSAITLTPGTAPTPAAGSIVMNADGTITVAAGTTAGTYSYPYTICEILNPTNCDTAIATVVVGAAPIDAVDDAPAAIVGATGGSTPTVLGNDTLNGAPVVPSAITLTPGTAPTPAAGSIVMNADGTVTVAAGTTAGTYSFPYTICENLNPTNCDTAIATVVVGAAVIDAVDDAPAAIVGATGGSTPTVLGNDTLNGVAVVPSAITLTPGTAPTPAAGSITMSPAGIITVAAGTTAGTYSFPYTICENINPTNCDTAIATVVVGAAVIDAVDDAPAAISGISGGSTPTVLGNDTLNGAPLVPSAITLTPGTAPTPAVGSIVMNPDGTITVAAGTTAGTYTYAYTICEILNPANCDTATATVVVGLAPIDAVDDTPAAISGITGGSTPTVLGNDTLNGAPVVPSAITLTPGTAPTPAAGSITMSTAGIITVAAGTTAGTYSYPYTICENLNPTNCDTATATVVVGAAVIDAVDDAPPTVSAVLGGTTPSVFANDTFNGAPIVPSSIVLTPGPAPAPAAGSITMNPDGTITVAAGTTPGTYSYSYTICEALNPTNCDTAIATVVVQNPGVTELVTDVSRGNQPGTAVTVRVLNNDRDPNSIFNAATLQIVGTGAPGEPLTVPGEGVWTVDLAAGTITFTPEPGFQGDPTPIQYQLRDLAGNLLAPAFVIITYDVTPAFVCSDVIGKVFDDKNHDGYQDPGEDGIPAARLATVNGTIITADEHGRFSVPCADIPRDIGSTFLLKLDPRSLPTGYRLTTENPRTVRLTPGMMSKMNFGVSLTDLVRIDLTAEAFVKKAGSDEEALSEDLEKGLKALVKQVAKKPSFVRMSYFVDGEKTELAEDRLKLVEDRLRDLWRARGKGKLGLETTVIEKN